MAKKKTGLTPTQKAYLQHCAENFVFFCENELKIVTKSAEVVPFIPNESQMEVLRNILTESSTRLAILKARQMGISTLIAAYFFWKTQFNPDTKCVVLAHENDSAAKLFKIYKTYYEKQSEWIKEEHPLKHSTKKEITFKKHSGSITIATAQNPEKLRSSTVQYLHCSEVAFWKDQKAVFTAAMQALTDRGVSFVETTANSFNYFFSWWNKNEGYAKLFLPWFALPSYQIKYVKEINRFYDIDDNEIALSKIEIKQVERDLAPDEQEYVTKHRLSHERIRWMKWAIANKCDDDWNIFHQEYPATVQDAFRFSGDSFFEGTWIPEDIKDDAFVIEPPTLGCSYVLGVDVAGGSIDGDHSAAMVLDVTQPKKAKPVAWIYKKCPVHEFSALVRRLGLKYNKALIVVETNNMGISVQEELYLEEYPRLYRRYSFDKMSERYVEKLGFYTTKEKRDLILNRLRKYVAKEWIRPLPAVLTNEMSSFVYTASGKPDHASGCYSDMIFATSLALEGISQLSDDRKQIFSEYHPKTPEEIVRFEVSTGLDWLTLSPMSKNMEEPKKFDAIMGDNLDF